MMEYKGYLATVEYDDSVGLLHGEVVNAAPYPIVTFEASSVEELKSEFRISIDDYLAWCKEDGVEPQRPFSGKLNCDWGRIFTDAWPFPLPEMALASIAG